VVEPAGAAPPAEPPGGGCAACAVNPGDRSGQIPELAALLGIVALASRMAGRRR
jgi:hypothetical protein